MNVFSFVVLAITFPIWGWFRKSLKTKWMEKQPKRYRNIPVEQTPNPFDKANWIKTGLSWGAFMFILMSVCFPYFYGEEITLTKILLEFGTWAITGLIFGYSMKIFFNAGINRKSKKYSG